MLENLKPVTVASLPISGHNLNLTISATARSSLPPLLNAVEFFTVAQLPNSPTFLDDFIFISMLPLNFFVSIIFDFLMIVAIYVVV